MEEKRSMEEQTKNPEQGQTGSGEMTMIDSTGSRAPSFKGDEKEKAMAKNMDTPQQEYLTGFKLATVFTGLLLAVFLFALDQTIVSTAQPRIVSQFNALDKIAWISSAYFLTQAGLMLTVGQILTVTSTKRVFLAAIFVFELGSLICGVAKSIDVLIFGRAVAGAGAAGMFTGILAIIGEVTRLEDRPLLFAAFGGAFAIASIIGPLLGGAFTDHVSWRWCFYINLPFGAITVGVVLLWLRTPPGHTKKSVFGDIPLWKKWLLMDWIGTALALGFVTCLVLALQWGGNTKPWNDGSVIACFVVFGVLVAAFVVWEYWLGDKAMLPTHLLRRRTQIGASWAAFFLFMCMILGTYYIPLWYQAKGSSAAKSGVNIIAFMLAMVVSSAVGGGFINKTGHYWSWMFFAPFLTSVGYGLMFTIHPDTPNGRILGFQILIGCGIGPAVNQTLLATQTEYAYEPHLIPQGTSIVTFLQIIGGLIGISVGSSIFGNKLATGLPILAPNLTPQQAMDVRMSVSDIFSLPPELQGGVIRAYSDALNNVFIIGVAAAALGSLSVLGIKNYNVLKRGGNVAAAMA